MDSEIRKKINELLSGTDKSKLAQAKRKIDLFLDTPDGIRMKKKLENTDREKLTDILKSVDRDQISNVLSGLSSNDISDIINALNNK